MKLTNLNFHQTFPPDEAMLSRLLTSDVFGEPLTKEEISMRSGIPTGKSSGKVEPHIAYASYMGLIEDTFQDGKHTLSLTDLGALVVNEDPGFSEEVTRMVCHLRLSSPFGGAPLWASVMSEILPKKSIGMSSSVLMDTLKKDTTVNINMGPFFSSYEDTLFSPLKLVERSNDTIKLNKHIASPDLIFVYAYALFREWEIRHKGQDEITAEEIEQFVMPGSLGWSQADLYAVMEAMQDKGLLVFNRQLTPYTVTKNYSSEMVEPRLYSELF